MPTGPRRPSPLTRSRIASASTAGSTKGFIQGLSRSSPSDFDRSLSTRDKRMGARRSSVQVPRAESPGWDRSLLSPARPGARCRRSRCYGLSRPPRSRRCRLSPNRTSALCSSTTIRSALPAENAFDQKRARGRRARRAPKRRRTSPEPSVGRERQGETKHSSMGNRSPIGSRMTLAARRHSTPNRLITHRKFSRKIVFTCRVWCARIEKACPERRPVEMRGRPRVQPRGAAAAGAFPARRAWRSAARSRRPA